MRIITLLGAFAATAALSGCFATLHNSSRAFEQGKAGSLSIWNSEYSAAVAYPDGKVCMQRALTVTAADRTVNANVSQAILAVAGAASSVAGGGGSSDLAKITTTLKETVTLLTTTTERTAFLDYGLFYVCQMAANGNLTTHQTAQLINNLMATAIGITSDSSVAGRSPLLARDMPKGPPFLPPPLAAPSASLTAAKLEE